MIKEMAWKTFKNTGNINTFLELRQLEDYEKSKLITNEDEKEIMNLNNDRSLTRASDVES